MLLLLNKAFDKSKWEGCIVYTYILTGFQTTYYIHNQNLKNIIQI